MEKQIKETIFIEQEKTRNLILDNFIDISKAHVKEHQRKTKSGKLVSVKEHNDKRNANIHNSHSKEKAKEIQKKIIEDEKEIKDIELEIKDLKKQKNKMDSIIFQKKMNKLQKHLLYYKSSLSGNKVYLRSGADFNENDNGEIRREREFVKNLRKHPDHYKKVVNSYGQVDYVLTKKGEEHYDKQTSKKVLQNLKEAKKKLSKAKNASEIKEAKEEIKIAESALKHLNSKKALKKSQSNDLAMNYMDISKAHVKAHTKRTKSGKMVQVKEHEDKRQKKNNSSSEEHLNILYKNRLKIVREYQKLKEEIGQEKISKIQKEKMKNIKETWRDLDLKISKETNRLEKNKAKDTTLKKENNVSDEKKKNIFKKIKKIAKLVKVDKLLPRSNKTEYLKAINKELKKLNDYDRKRAYNMAKNIINEKKKIQKSIDNILEKAHIKSHTKKTKSGKIVQVKEHEDKRQKKQENKKEDKKIKLNFSRIQSYPYHAGREVENYITKRDSISKEELKHYEDFAKKLDKQTYKDINDAIWDKVTQNLNLKKNISHKHFVAAIGFVGEQISKQEGGIEKSQSNELVMDYIRIK